MQVLEQRTMQKNRPPSTLKMRDIVQNFFGLRTQFWNRWFHKTEIQHRPPPRLAAVHLMDLDLTQTAVLLTGSRISV